MVSYRIKSSFNHFNPNLNLFQIFLIRIVQWWLRSVRSFSKRKNVKYKSWSCLKIWIWNLNFMVKNDGQTLNFELNVLNSFSVLISHRRINHESSIMTRAKVLFQLFHREHWWWIWNSRRWHFSLLLGENICWYSSFGVFPFYG